MKSLQQSTPGLLKEFGNCFGSCYFRDLDYWDNLNYYFEDK